MASKSGEKYIIAVCTLVLGALGILMIYSASSYSATLSYNDPFFYVKKQAIAYAIGIAAMIFASKINLEFFIKVKWFVYLLSAVLLALVFIPGLGVESYGATRWINLGVTTFQPSEISKFGLMIFLACFFEKNPPTGIKNLGIALLLSGIICALIVIEPNMSITICVVLCVGIIIFMAGAPKKWFGALIALIGVALPALVLLEPYRVKRIMAFVDPWQNPKGEGYQLIQSYYALGSGGLFGVGLFNSRQKFLFLPFAESDFIFSIIGEELGLFGCAGVIIVFAALIICGYRVASKADTRYHTLLAIGLTSVIAVQTLVNIAVVTGSIPPTGLPLPYISAGGTSLITFMTVSGLLMNISTVTNRRLLP